MLAAVSLQHSGLHRVFEITFGDKKPFHVTLVVTVRADGTLWPPPLVIHSCPGSEDPSLTHFEAEGIYERQPDGSYVSASGVQVLVSQNGSMTQKLFPEYVDHFLTNVRDDGLGILLIFDGHVSRWVAPALLKLMQRGVAPFCLA